METHAAPEQTQHDAIPCGPPIRQLFRDVIADRVPDRMPLQAAMLFGSEIDPAWDDRSFLAEFYNEILHQDTCQPHTADGLALLAALAVDDRTPPPTGSKPSTCCFAPPPSPSATSPRPGRPPRNMPIPIARPGPATQSCCTPLIYWPAGQPNAPRFSWPSPVSPSSSRRTAPCPP
ncbi:hypothetical protein [Streptomyces sp. NPDC091416]|uniref:hypothetical protein n=1 Tax=Streptomyces sp. NPDC091416 TaxID=3366003 RepID=UPI0037F9E2FE